MKTTGIIFSLDYFKLAHLHMLNWRVRWRFSLLILHLGDLFATTIRLD
jgi:hypothetical protein